jgi:FkbM family methyltransferase
MTALHGLRRGGLAMQRLIARSRLASRAYLLAMSFACRNLLPRGAAAHLRVLVLHPESRWPDLAFRPASVRMGQSTEVRLTPHLGEFDQNVLFSKVLDHEPEVCRWFETDGAARYETVIEIGANVGLFSVFLNAVAAKPGARLRRIVSFEPSREAFARLAGNLTSNRAEHVLPFMAAVGEEAGFRSFFEPQGHLCNGSFDADFAGIFAGIVRQTTVAVQAAASLELFLPDAGPALVKIDAEGAEPEVLAALGDLVARRRPDLLVEVLPETVASIAAIPWLRDYELHLITPDGPQPRPRLSAEAEHRDWLFLSRAGPARPTTPSAEDEARSCVT